MIAGAGVGTLLSAIALACLWAMIGAVRHREWKFAAGALAFACFFSLYSLPFWEAAATGDFPSSGDEEPAPRSR